MMTRRNVFRWFAATLLLLLSSALMAAVPKSVLLLAFPAAIAAPASIGQKRKDLAALLKELEAGQKEMSDGPLSEARGQELEQKAHEAEALQDEIDAYDKRERLIKRGREISDPNLPAGPGEEKNNPKEIAGYMTFGQMYVASPAFKEFVDGGRPKASIAAILEATTTNDGLIPVTREMIESKAVVDASGIIRPDRVQRIVDAARPQRLFLRDLVEVLQTNSSSVEYYTQTYTEAGAIVAPSGTKPEASVVFGNANAPVRDIAVTTPIREQTLQDAPQIQGIIDGRMRRDLRKVEEKEMLWGDGTGFLGIFNTPGVGEMVRTLTGATLLDKIRMAVTDIQLAEVDPDGMAVHPLDWEGIQLLKGTDARYVWIVVTDSVTQQSRVWGLSVVTTKAVVKPALTERRILVGSFQECATLWDRNEITAAIGWVNDQFRKNERTIRLEERAAFAAHTPFGFRYVVAANAGS